ncbi:hypothetical protein CTI12_AA488930 [Artemisia annua]|uniref:Uncharacterized protein n=1 Tax=Artemisia annua TaxID=35608 RepID=A0A2U1LHZ2_ARTAN|nr:hypothetical protein CTI12_AA488930 [Artemisia annua]
MGLGRMMGRSNDSLFSLAYGIFSVQWCGFLKHAKSTCILAGKHHGSGVCSHGGLKAHFTQTTYLGEATLHAWYACNLRFHEAMMSLRVRRTIDEVEFVTATDKESHQVLA